MRRCASRVSQKKSGASLWMRRRANRASATLSAAVAATASRLARRLAISRPWWISIDSLAPGLEVAERGVRPDVGKWDRRILFGPAWAAIWLRVEDFALRRTVPTFAVHRLIVREAARLLIGVETSAVLRRLKLVAVVRCAGVLRMERVGTGEFRFAFGNGELALVLRSELLGRETQSAGCVVSCAAHAVCAAHFDRTRARVTSEQYVADCSVFNFSSAAASAEAMAAVPFDRRPLRLCRSWLCGAWGCCVASENRHSAGTSDSCCFMVRPALCFSCHVRAEGGRRVCHDCE
eukprot:4561598-Pleurochrysis_carterae.AAC.2